MGRKARLHSALPCACVGNFARNSPSLISLFFYRFLFPNGVRCRAFLSLSLSLLPLRRRISLMDLSRFPFRGLISPLQQHQDKHSERPTVGEGNYRGKERTDLKSGREERERRELFIYPALSHSLTLRASLLRLKVKEEGIILSLLHLILLLPPLCS